ncbi:MAG: hypothetical protein ACLUKN_13265 [Bacilli bacterium]
MSVIKFAVCDAVSIGFGDGSSGGAVFGFNGLMQIHDAKIEEKLCVK